MSIVSSLDLVRRVPMFSDLTTAQLSSFCANLEKTRFKKGDYIIRQGAVSGKLFMLLTGKANIVVADERGREVIMASVSSGDCVGEMSLIDGEPHSASVRTETVVDVLSINRMTFMHCVAENPILAEAVMRYLVKRLRQADQKIEDLALKDVYSRVYSALYAMARKDEQGQMRIEEKVSRLDLAKKVGASREMVSRVLKLFEDKQVMRPLENGGMVLHERPEEFK